MSTPAAPSFVRTLVPIAVGQIVAYVGTLGVSVPKDVETAFTVVLGFVVASAYYAAIRLLEQKFPWMGALLGWAATPDGYSAGQGIESDDDDIDEDDDPGEFDDAFDDDEEEADEDIDVDLDDEVDDEADTDDEATEELDDLETTKADEQAALDEKLTDETPVDDDYEARH